mmetsp:Transcript_24433/g.70682  ORF Transcript_24433/g.70682 Transcript_24433/m.70682 type:complete len:457 (+) Transcript_24433:711-2081(+)
MLHVARVHGEAQQGHDASNQAEAGGEERRREMRALRKLLLLIGVEIKRRTADAQGERGLQHKEHVHLGDLGPQQDVERRQQHRHDQDRGGEKHHLGLEQHALQGEEHRGDGDQPAQKHDFALVEECLPQVSHLRSCQLLLFEVVRQRRDEHRGARNDASHVHEARAQVRYDPPDDGYGGQVAHRDAPPHIGHEVRAILRAFRQVFGISRLGQQIARRHLQSLPPQAEHHELGGGVGCGREADQHGASDTDKGGQDTVRPPPQPPDGDDVGHGADQRLQCPSGARDGNEDLHLRARKPVLHEKPHDGGGLELLDDALQQVLRSEQEPQEVAPVSVFQLTEPTGKADEGIQERLQPALWRCGNEHRLLVRQALRCGGRHAVAALQGPTTQGGGLGVAGRVHAALGKPSLPPLLKLGLPLRLGAAACAASLPIAEGEELRHASGRRQRRRRRRRWRLGK